MWSFRLIARFPKADRQPAATYVPLPHFGVVHTVTSWM
jgi:hypothetical protein